MRVIVSVSRTFCDYSLLARTIDMAIEEKSKTEIEIISAHVNGASSLILKYCREHNVPYKHFQIQDYLTFGGNAERIRISNMINYAVQDQGVMFAFWDGKSPNTESIIRTASNHRMDGYIMDFINISFTDLLSVHDLNK